MLQEDELAVFGRGRNAKPKTVPKHAGLEAYAYATGLECLFGYLYLLGRNERIDELWQAVAAEIDPVQA
jgi:ribonuclease-3 family protein